MRFKLFRSNQNSRAKPAGFQHNGDNDRIRLSKTSERLVRDTKFSEEDINKAFARARKLQGA